MKKYILFLIILITQTAWSQDSHFSDYGTAPLELNPAMAGFLQGNHRLNIKYREQWKSVLDNDSYKTIYASYDGRKCFDRNFLAWGASFLADRAGIHNFTTLHANLSLAFHQNLSNKLFLAGAFQAGIIQYSLDDDNLQFDRQFDGFDFNENWSHSENFDQFNIILPDLSAGILVYDIDKKLTLGAAIYHVNQPTYSFLKNETDPNQVFARFTFYGSFDIPIVSEKTRKKYLNINALFMRQQPLSGQHWQLRIGTEKRIRLSKNNARRNFYGGISARFVDGFKVDAIIPSVRLAWDNLVLSASYDWNVSGLTRVSRGRGGLEVGVRWEFVQQVNDCVICW